MQWGNTEITVPDFENLNKVYEKTKKIIKNVIGPIMEGGPFQMTEFFISNKIFDEESLKIYLKKKGFMNIRRWDFCELQALDPNYDDHSRAHFLIWILKMEYI